MVVVLFLLIVLGVPTLLAWGYLRLIKKQTRKEAIGNLFLTTITGILGTITFIGIIIML